MKHCGPLHHTRLNYKIPPSSLPHINKHTLMCPCTLHRHTHTRNLVQLQRAGCACRAGADLVMDFHAVWCMAHGSLHTLNGHEDMHIIVVLEIITSVFWQHSVQPSICRCQLLFCILFSLWTACTLRSMHASLSAEIKSGRDPSRTDFILFWHSICMHWPYRVPLLGWTFSENRSSMWRVVSL